MHLIAIVGREGVTTLALHLSRFVVERLGVIDSFASFLIRHTLRVLFFFAGVRRASFAMREISLRRLADNFFAPSP